MLPMLILIALLTSGWLCAGIIIARGTTAKRAVARPNFAHRQVSLWSLILILFFPSLVTSSTSSLSLRENN